jgi:hypothetical protein
MVGMSENISESIAVKLALAAALSLYASQALAGGVAVYDQPFSDDYRVRVLLSDVPKQAEDCNGMIGQLGKLELKSRSGREVKDMVGCWRFVSEDSSVTFTATMDGEWRHWSFPASKFDRL